MKVFESILEAMRYIKSELPDVEYMDNLYLLSSAYGAEYIVSDSESELEKAIEEDWYNGGCEGNPDKHAEDFKVWAYITADHKEKFPTLYTNYKPCVLSKSHVRGSASVYGEVVASFSVSIH